MQTAVCHITQYKPHHRHKEFLPFLQHLDEQAPPNLELHLIIDHYAAYKPPNGRAWLASYVANSLLCDSKAFRHQL